MVKRTLTLLEIMIVIFLITIITGAIGYNMKGALEKGKVFRTERAIEQLKEIVQLRLAEGHKMTEILSHLEDHLKMSGLAKDPESLVKDGWGVPFEIRPNRRRDGVDVISKKLLYHNNQNKKQSNQQSDPEEDDI